MRDHHAQKPSAPSSERSFAPKRSAFMTSLLAAALLVLLAATGAVYRSAVQPERFENALLSSVDAAALYTDEQSLRGFARETILYLTDAQRDWNPQISLGGVPASAFIPQSFRDHMKTVKGWFVPVKTLLFSGAFAALVLLWLAVRGGGKRRFSAGGYYLGAALPLLALGGVGVWAYADFDGMWAWLHRTFIPDGIFNAAEPVMQLFPLEAFAAYAPPVATTFAVWVALILALPLLLSPLSKRSARFAADRATNGRRSRSKTRRTER